ncbi:MAG: DUF1015 family protein [Balneolales bacterium]|nr:DUF1015 family protein [Balneolales bacterium]
MAQIKPFKAWQPKPDYLEKTACVPYDVINTAQARKLSHGNPFSFLRVIRPEIDLDKDIDIYSDEVYQIGRKNLYDFLESERFEQDSEEHLYLYRLKWKGKSRTGVFGCVSVEDYDNDIILKHELTTPIKEDDRTKHIITQQAHAEPVMITFRGNSDFQQLMEYETQKDPIFSFSVEDEVEHTIWNCSENKRFIELFADVGHLYIADGHHRCASASRAAKEIDSTLHPEVHFFPAVLFPMDELEILAYNRIVYEVPKDFLEAVSSSLELIPDANPVPTQKGTVAIYMEGNWWGLNLPESTQANASAQLDIARLQEFVLEPLLGIKNQRTDKNISFVGGIHGVETLQSLVDSGEAKLAISLYPTSIEELVAVSDARELMPPKSTWFEPKLRSGILIHTF